MGALNSAVVIIDMQEDVVRGPWFTWVPPVERIVTACHELVAAAHQRGVPVLYTKVEYKPDGSNTPVAVASGEPTPFPFLNEGTPGVAVVPELQPEPDDVVLTKNLISAFDAPGFADVLESLGIHRLVLAGIQLEYALLLTAKEAASRGFAVTVVSEGSGASSEDAYEQHVTELLPPIASVMTLAEVMASLAD